MITLLLFFDNLQQIIKQRKIKKYVKRISVVPKKDFVEWILTGVTIFNLSFLKFLIDCDTGSKISPRGSL